MTFNVKVALINQKQNYKTKNNLLKNEHKHPKRIVNQRITYRKTNNTSKQLKKSHFWFVTLMLNVQFSQLLITIPEEEDSWNLLLECNCQC